MLPLGSNLASRVLGRLVGDCDPREIGLPTRTGELKGNPFPSLARSPVHTQTSETAILNEPGPGNERSTSNHFLVASMEGKVSSYGRRLCMFILLQDLRYTLRQLAKSPGFALTAVLTLALGIGANTAIFSFVDAALLKPLPYPHPEQIVSVWEKPPEGVTNFISTMNFLDWEQQNHCFQFLSAVARDTVTLTGSDSPQELNVQRVSASYFRMLGVNAMLGRTFVAGEDEVGKDQEVVLSNRVWQSRFGGDPNVIAARSRWMQKITRSSAYFPLTLSLTGPGP